MPSRRSSAGFSLVELMFSLAIIATASLMLSATLASQQKMTALARERVVATNAIRAYMEAMRQQYPSAGSTDMTGFINDTTTPVDYLPTVGVETGTITSAVMVDPRGLVLKMRDESGAHWGSAAGVTGSITTQSASQTWLWTDATMATVGAVNLATLVPTVSDLDSMGFVSLAGNTTVTTGRDLDASGTITAGNLTTTTQILVPCQITLSWKSGSGGAQSSNAQTSRQRITLYAAFSPVH